MNFNLVICVLFQMFMFNRFLRQSTNIIFLRTNFILNCKNIRNVSTIKDLEPKEFRKKTEHFSFNSVDNNETDADIFGMLNNNVDTNDKLNYLPPEDDDVIQYDKDEQHKRLHISEYQKIIQNLIKQHKVKI